MKSKTRVLFTLFFTARVALIALGIGIGLLAIPRVAAAQQDKIDDDVEDVSWKAMLPSTTPAALYNSTSSPTLP
jgi:hypothetical protein